MFRRFRILIGVLIYLGVFFVVFGVISVSNKNWVDYKSEFTSEKSSVINHYIVSLATQLESIVYANAYWTEGIIELYAENNDWLAANATTYVTDMDSYNIDYIFIANESVSYTQESGLNLENELLLRQEVQDSLLNDKVRLFFMKSSVGYAFVLSSPWMDNEHENPTGVYVALSLLDEVEILNLQNTLGGELVNRIEIVKRNQLSIVPTEKQSEHTLWNQFENISLLNQLLDSEYDLWIDFKLKSIHGIFSTSRNYILTIVFLSASLIFIIIALFLKFIEIWILKITSNITLISEGNYDIHLYEKKSVIFKEINDLTNAVNRMSKDLKENIKTIDNNYLEMVDVIIKAVEINDQYTSHHNIAVGEYSKIIANKMGYEDMKALELAAKLHDIGKISIPSHILNKPGKLTIEEFEIIKTHPLEGYNIIYHLDYFSDIRLGILYHHERWDGKGYPQGLKGDEIPLMAQIISVADVYDAVTSDRAYRKGISHTEAVDLITSNSGSMFNPILVEAFLSEVVLFENELEKRRSFSS